LDYILHKNKKSPPNKKNPQKKNTYPQTKTKKVFLNTKTIKVCLHTTKKTKTIKPTNLLNKCPKNITHQNKENKNNQKSKK
jgi:hypothetical protein